MKTAPFALALLVLPAAARAQAAPQDWRRLEGQHSGITRPLAVAVQDARKWAELWREHDASAPVPPVDFAREDVVAVFLGERRTAGVEVGITVRKDPLDGSRLDVFYREIDSKKEISAQVICEPFAMVKVPRAAVIDVEPDGSAGSSGPPSAPRAAVDPARLGAYRALAEPSFDGR